MLRRVGGWTVSYRSCSLNSFKGAYLKTPMVVPCIIPYYGILQGTTIGVIKGEPRSLAMKVGSVRCKQLTPSETSCGSRKINGRNLFMNRQKEVYRPDSSSRGTCMWLQDRKPKPHEA